MTLSPLHEKFRSENYSHLSEDEFIEAVCSGIVVMPEDKLEAHVAHLPCGVPRKGDGFTAADRTQEAKEKTGWRKAKYLLILPSPAPYDYEYGAFSKHSWGGSFLREELEHAGINLEDVVATHVCRFSLPDGMKVYSDKHKKANLPYLMRDIVECDPDVIITVGADSLRSVLGKNVKLDTYRGSVPEMKIGDTTYKIVPTISHLSFMHEYANIAVFRSELRRAAEVADGTFSSARPIGEYLHMKTADEIVSFCERLLKEKPQHISLDTEFGNDKAREEFTYTLSVQLGWGRGKAAFIQLRDQVVTMESCNNGKFKKDGTPRKSYREWTREIHSNGLPMHTAEDTKRIWSALQELLGHPDIRLDGHNLKVDIDQCHRNGCNIDHKLATGFCTMLAHHVLCGDEDQGLDHLVRKYMSNYGAYWAPVEEYLTKTRKRTKILRYGYRDIPLDILVPYAQIDADVTWQLAEVLEAELEKTPSLSNLFWNLSMPTALHLLDVERQGLLVDDDRRAELFSEYRPLYDEILAELRADISWPKFLASSAVHKASLLYSTTMYRGKKEAPAEARCLSLKPLYNTDKHARSWEDIEADGECKQHSPSVAAKHLKEMVNIYKDVPILKKLYQLSVLGKFLSTYLRRIEMNDHGVPEDGKGFHNNIWSDGRVRTHIGQLTQTGRYTSNKAALQTTPKKQEDAALGVIVDRRLGLELDDYKRRSDKKYDGPDPIPKEQWITIPKFKTCIVPDDGYVLIEADYKGAELAGWAYLSDDPGLIKITDTGRDLHSEVACSSFNLPEGKDLPRVIAALDSGDYKQYKAWNDNFKKIREGPRVASKSVNFG